MKIAIFTDTFVPDVNGVAKTLSRFTDYLSAHGHQYQVFAPKSTKETRFSSQVHQLSSLPFFIYPDCHFSIPNLLHVKGEMQQFQPDIVHIATPFNVGLCGLHYAKKFNIPLVGSYHTDFDKYLAYYNLQLFSKPLWKYFRWFHRPMKKIFVPSTDTLERLQLRGFQNMDIWGRGIDTTLFHPNYPTNHVRKTHKIKEKYILTYVGRLSPEKDVELLLEINNQLPGELSSQIRWLIVGDGPSKQELIKQAAPNMTFTGYLHGEELAKTYACSDLFVFPSPTETFGNVVLEAAASGTPTIAANSGGVTTIVQHGKTGLLCEPSNPQAFSHQIQNILHDNSLRLKMGIQARNYALTQTWDSIFERLLSQYEDVIAEEVVVAKNA